MTCPTCGAALPPDSRFCIECGAELPVPASTGATVTLAPAVPGLVCPACGAASPAGADYCIRCGSRLRPAARPAPALRVCRRRGRAASLSAGLFLAGLILLVLLKLPIFPLIFIVLGLAAFTYLAARGRPLAGVGVALWLFSVVFLARVPRLLVPGLIALGVIAVMTRLTAARARRP